MTIVQRFSLMTMLLTSLVFATITGTREEVQEKYGIREEVRKQSSLQNKKADEESFIQMDLQDDSRIQMNMHTESLSQMKKEQSFIQMNMNEQMSEQLAKIEMHQRKMAEKHEIHQLELKKKLRKKQKEKVDQHFKKISQYMGKRFNTQHGLSKKLSSTVSKHLEDKLRRHIKKSTMIERQNRQQLRMQQLEFERERHLEQEREAEERERELEREQQLEQEQLERERSMLQKQGQKQGIGFAVEEKEGMSQTEKQGQKMSQKEKMGEKVEEKEKMVEKMSQTEKMGEKMSQKEKMGEKMEQKEKMGEKLEEKQKMRIWPFTSTPAPQRGMGQMNGQGGSTNIVVLVPGNHGKNAVKPKNPFCGAYSVSKHAFSSIEKADDISVGFSEDRSNTQSGVEVVGSAVVGSLSSVSSSGNANQSWCTPSGSATVHNEAVAEYGMSSDELQKRIRRFSDMLAMIAHTPEMRDRAVAYALKSMGFLYPDIRDSEFALRGKSSQKESLKVEAASKPKGKSTAEANKMEQEKVAALQKQLATADASGGDFVRSTIELKVIEYSQDIMARFWSSIENTYKKKYIEALEKNDSDAVANLKIRVFAKEMKKAGESQDNGEKNLDYGASNLRNAADKWEIYKSQRGEAGQQELYDDRVSRFEQSLIGLMLNPYNLGRFSKVDEVLPPDDGKPWPRPFEEAHSTYYYTRAAGKNEKTPDNDVEGKLGDDGSNDLKTGVAAMKGYRFMAPHFHQTSRTSDVLKQGSSISSDPLLGRIESYEYPFNDIWELVDDHQPSQIVKKLLDETRGKTVKNSLHKNSDQDPEVILHRTVVETGKLITKLDQEAEEKRQRNDLMGRIVEESEKQKSGGATIKMRNPEKKKQKSEISKMGATKSPLEIALMNLTESERQIYNYAVSWGWAKFGEHRLLLCRAYQSRMAQVVRFANIKVYNKKYGSSFPMNKSSEPKSALQIAFTDISQKPVGSNNELNGSELKNSQERNSLDVARVETEQDKPKEYSDKDFTDDDTTIGSGKSGNADYASGEDAKAYIKAAKHDRTNGDTRGQLKSGQGVMTEAGRVIKGIILKIKIYEWQMSQLTDKDGTNNSIPGLPPVVSERVFKLRPELENKLMSSLIMSPDLYLLYKSLFLEEIWPYLQKFNRICGNVLAYVQDNFNDRGEIYSRIGEYADGSILSQPFFGKTNRSEGDQTLKSLSSSSPTFVQDDDFLPMPGLFSGMPLGRQKEKISAEANRKRKWNFMLGASAQKYYIGDRGKRPSRLASKLEQAKAAWDEEHGIIDQSNPDKDAVRTNRARYSIPALEKGGDGWENVDQEKYLVWNINQIRKAMPPNWNRGLGSELNSREEFLPDLTLYFPITSQLQRPEMRILEKIAAYVPLPGGKLNNTPAKQSPLKGLFGETNPEGNGMELVSFEGRKVNPVLELVELKSEDWVSFRENLASFTTESNGSTGSFTTEYSLYTAIQRQNGLEDTKAIDRAIQNQLGGSGDPGSGTSDNQADNQVISSLKKAFIPYKKFPFQRMQYFPVPMGLSTGENFLRNYKKVITVKMSAPRKSNTPHFVYLDTRKMIRGGDEANGDSTKNEDGIVETYYRIPCDTFLQCFVEQQDRVIQDMHAHMNRGDSEDLSRQIVEIKEDFEQIAQRNVYLDTMLDMQGGASYGGNPNSEPLKPIISQKSLKMRVLKLDFLFVNFIDRFVEGIYLFSDGKPDPMGGLSIGSGVGFFLLKFNQIRKVRYSEKYDKARKKTQADYASTRTSPTKSEERPGRGLPTGEKDVDPAAEEAAKSLAASEERDKWIFGFREKRKSECFFARSIVATRYLMTKWLTMSELGAIGISLYSAGQFFEDVYTLGETDYFTKTLEKMKDSTLKLLAQEEQWVTAAYRTHLLDSEKKTEIDKDQEIRDKKKKFNWKPAQFEDQCGNDAPQEEASYANECGRGKQKSTSAAPKSAGSKAYELYGSGMYADLAEPKPPTQEEYPKTRARLKTPTAFEEAQKKYEEDKSDYDKKMQEKKELEGKLVKEISQKYVAELNGDRASWTQKQNWIRERYDAYQALVNIYFSRIKMQCFMVSVPFSSEGFGAIEYDSPIGADLILLEESNLASEMVQDHAKKLSSLPDFWSVQYMVKEKEKLAADNNAADAPKQSADASASFFEEVFDKHRWTSLGAFVKGTEENTKEGKKRFEKTQRNPLRGFFGTRFRQSKSDIDKTDSSEWSDLVFSWNEKDRWKFPDVKEIKFFDVLDDGEGGASSANSMVREYRPYQYRMASFFCALGINVYDPTVMSSASENTSNNGSTSTITSGAVEIKVTKDYKENIEEADQRCASIQELIHNRMGQFILEEKNLDIMLGNMVTTIESIKARLAGSEGSLPVSMLRGNMITASSNKRELTRIAANLQEVSSNLRVNDIINNNLLNNSVTMLDGKNEISMRYNIGSLQDTFLELYQALLFIPSGNVYQLRYLSEEMKKIECSGQEISSNRCSSVNSAKETVERLVNEKLHPGSFFVSASSTLVNGQKKSEKENAKDVVASSNVTDDVSGEVQKFEKGKTLKAKIESIVKGGDGNITNCASVLGLVATLRIVIFILENPATGMGVTKMTEFLEGGWLKQFDAIKTTMQRELSFTVGKEKKSSKSTENREKRSTENIEEGIEKDIAWNEDRRIVKNDTNQRFANKWKQLSENWHLVEKVVGPISLESDVGPESPLFQSDDKIEKKLTKIFLNISKNCLILPNSNPQLIKTVKDRILAASVKRIAEEEEKTQNNSDTSILTLSHSTIGNISSQAFLQETSNENAETSTAELHVSPPTEQENSRTTQEQIVREIWEEKWRKDRNIREKKSRTEEEEHTNETWKIRKNAVLAFILTVFFLWWWCLPGIPMDNSGGVSRWGSYWYCCLCTVITMIFYVCSYSILSEVDRGEAVIILLSVVFSYGFVEVIPMKWIGTYVKWEKMIVKIFLYYLMFVVCYVSLGGIRDVCLSNDGPMNSDSSLSQPSRPNEDVTVGVQNSPNTWSRCGNSLKERLNRVWLFSSNESIGTICGRIYLKIVEVWNACKPNWLRWNQNSTEVSEYRVDNEEYNDEGEDEEEKPLFSSGFNTKLEDLFSTVVDKIHHSTIGREDYVNMIDKGLYSSLILPADVLQKNSHVREILYLVQRRMELQKTNDIFTKYVPVTNSNEGFDELAMLDVAYDLVIDRSPWLVFVASTVLNIVQLANQLTKSYIGRTFALKELILAIADNGRPNPKTIAQVNPAMLEKQNNPQNYYGQNYDVQEFPNQAQFANANDNDSLEYVGGNNSFNVFDNGGSETYVGQSYFEQMSRVRELQRKVAVRNSFLEISDNSVISSFLQGGKSSFIQGSSTLKGNEFLKERKSNLRGTQKARRIETRKPRTKKSGSRNKQIEGTSFLQAEQGRQNAGKNNGNSDSLNDAVNAVCSGIMQRVRLLLIANKDVGKLDYISWEFNLACTSSLTETTKPFGTEGVPRNPSEEARRNKRVDSNRTRLIAQMKQLKATIDNTGTRPNQTRGRRLEDAKKAELGSAARQFFVSGAREKGLTAQARAAREDIAKEHKADQVGKTAENPQSSVNGVDLASPVSDMKTSNDNHADYQLVDRLKSDSEQAAYEKNQEELDPTVERLTDEANAELNKDHSEDEDTVDEDELARSGALADRMFKLTYNFVGEITTTELLKEAVEEDISVMKSSQETKGKLLNNLRFKMDSTAEQLKRALSQITTAEGMLQAKELRRQLILDLSAIASNEENKEAMRRLQQVVPTQRLEHSYFSLMMLKRVREIIMFHITVPVDHGASSFGQSGESLASSTSAGEENAASTVATVAAEKKNSWWGLGKFFGGGGGAESVAVTDPTAVGASGISTSSSGETPVPPEQNDPVLRIVLAALFGAYNQENIDTNGHNPKLHIPSGFAKPMSYAEDVHGVSESLQLLCIKLKNIYDRYLQIYLVEYLEFLNMEARNVDKIGVANTVLAPVIKKIEADQQHCKVSFTSACEKRYGSNPEVPHKNPFFGKPSNTNVKEKSAALLVPIVSSHTVKIQSKATKVVLAAFFDGVFKPLHNEGDVDDVQMHNFIKQNATSEAEVETDEDNQNLNEPGASDEIVAKYDSEERENNPDLTYMVALLDNAYTTLRVTGAPAIASFRDTVLTNFFLTEVIDSINWNGISDPSSDPTLEKSRLLALYMKYENLNSWQSKTPYFKFYQPMLKMLSDNLLYIATDRYPVRSEEDQKKDRKNGLGKKLGLHFPPLKNPDRPLNPEEVKLRDKVDAEIREFISKATEVANQGMESNHFIPEGDKNNKASQGMQHDSESGAPFSSTFAGALSSPMLEIFKIYNDKATSRNEGTFACTFPSLGNFCEENAMWPSTRDHSKFTQQDGFILGEYSAGVGDESGVFYTMFAYTFPFTTSIVIPYRLKSYTSNEIGSLFIQGGNAAVKESSSGGSSLSGEMRRGFAKRSKGLGGLESHCTKGTAFGMKGLETALGIKVGKSSDGDKPESSQLDLSVDNDEEDQLDLTSLDGQLRVEDFYITKYATVPVIGDLLFVPPTHFQREAREKENSIRDINKLKGSSTVVKEQGGRISSAISSLISSKWWSSLTNSKLSWFGGQEDDDGLVDKRSALDRANDFDLSIYNLNLVLDSPDLFDETEDALIRALPAKCLLNRMGMMRNYYYLLSFFGATPHSTDILDRKYATVAVQLSHSLDQFVGSSGIPIPYNSSPGSSPPLLGSTSALSVLPAEMYLKDKDQENAVGVMLYLLANYFTYGVDLIKNNSAYTLNDGSTSGLNLSSGSEAIQRTKSDVPQTVEGQFTAADLIGFITPPSNSLEAIAASHWCASQSALVTAMVVIADMANSFSSRGSTGATSHDSGSGQSGSHITDRFLSLIQGSRHVSPILLQKMVNKLTPVYQSSGGSKSVSGVSPKVTALSYSGDSSSWSVSPSPVDRLVEGFRTLQKLSQQRTNILEEARQEYEQSKRIRAQDTGLGDESAQKKEKVYADVLPDTVNEAQERLQTDFRNMGITPTPMSASLVAMDETVSEGAGRGMGSRGNPIAVSLSEEDVLLAMASEPSEDAADRSVAATGTNTSNGADGTEDVISNSSVKPDGEEANSISIQDSVPNDNSKMNEDVLGLSNPVRNQFLVELLRDFSKRLTSFKGHCARVSINTDEAIQDGLAPTRVEQTVQTADSAQQTDRPLTAEASPNNRQGEANSGKAPGSEQEKPVRALNIGVPDSVVDDNGLRVKVMMRSLVDQLQSSSLPAAFSETALLGVASNIRSHDAEAMKKANEQPNEAAAAAAKEAAAPQGKSNAEQVKEFPAKSMAASSFTEGATATGWRGTFTKNWDRQPLASTEEPLFSSTNSFIADSHGSTSFTASSSGSVFSSDPESSRAMVSFTEVSKTPSLSKTPTFKRGKTTFSSFMHKMWASLVPLSVKLAVSSSNVQSIVDGPIPEISFVAVAAGENETNQVNNDEGKIENPFRSMVMTSEEALSSSGQAYVEEFTRLRESLKLIRSIYETGFVLDDLSRELFIWNKYVSPSVPEEKKANNKVNGGDHDPTDGENARQANASDREKIWDLLPYVGTAASLLVNFIQYNYPERDDDQIGYEINKRHSIDQNSWSNHTPGGYVGAEIRDKYIYEEITKSLDVTTNVFTFMIDNLAAVEEYGFKTFKYWFENTLKPFFKRYKKKFMDYFWKIADFLWNTCLRPVWNSQIMVWITSSGLGRFVGSLFNFIGGTIGGIFDSIKQWVFYSSATYRMDLRRRAQQNAGEFADWHSGGAGMGSKMGSNLQIREGTSQVGEEHVLAIPTNMHVDVEDKDSIMQKPPNNMNKGFSNSSKEIMQEDSSSQKELNRNLKSGGESALSFLETDAKHEEAVENYVMNTKAMSEYYYPMEYPITSSKTIKTSAIPNDEILSDLKSKDFNENELNSSIRKIQIILYSVIALTLIILFLIFLVPILVVRKLRRKNIRKRRTTKDTENKISENYKVRKQDNKTQECGNENEGSGQKSRVDKEGSQEQGLV